MDRAQCRPRCQDEWKSELGGTWAFLSVRVWVYTCRRRLTHFLHYCRTQGRSLQTSSGMSSILFHKHKLIYGHLPSFCSVVLCLCFLNAPHPTRSHKHTLLLMLVSYGKRREWLFPMQEVMWLILIWSPVLMASFHDQQSRHCLCRLPSLLLLVGAGSICNICKDWWKWAHMSAREAVSSSHATHATLQVVRASGGGNLFDL